MSKSKYHNSKQPVGAAFSREDSVLHNLCCEHEAHEERDEHEGHEKKKRRQAQASACVNAQPQACSCACTWQSFSLHW
jgi:hypothetical protein